MKVGHVHEAALSSTRRLSTSCFFWRSMAFCGASSTPHRRASTIAGRAKASSRDALNSGSTQSWRADLSGLDSMNFPSSPISRLPVRPRRSWSDMQSRPPASWSPRRPVPPSNLLDVQNSRKDSEGARTQTLLALPVMRPDNGPEHKTLERPSWPHEPVELHPQTAASDTCSLVPAPT